MGRRYRVAAGLVGALAALVLLISGPSLAAAAECTRTWTGAVSGEWQIAENWSPEAVPTSSDVACVPKEKAAQVVSGSQIVELLQGEGRVTIAAGSLAVMGGEQSHIQRLNLTGGALRGPGELLVTEFLHGDGGSMEGAGRTVIGAEASGHVDPQEEGPGLRLTEQRELDTKGLLEVGGLGGQLNVVEGAALSVLNAGELAVKGPAGGVGLSESADLVNDNDVSVAGPEAEIRGSDGIGLDNSGTLLVNAEGAGNGLVAGTGTTPKLVNTGTVRKSEGSETTIVGFKVDNEDLVEAQSGTLAFIAGGNSGQEKLDTWVAVEEEGQIAFAQGAFTFGEEAAMSGVILGLEKASLKSHRFKAGGAEVWLNDASLEITEAGKESNFAILGTEYGAIELVGKGMLDAGKLFVEEGSFDGGAESTLNLGRFELEGGSMQIDAGSDVDLGDSYLEAGETTIGAGSVVEGGDPYLAQGSLEVGPNSKIDLGRFYQEEGETTIGSGSIVEASSPYLEHGPFEIGADSTADLGGFFIQEATATIGVGSQLNAKNLFIENGSLQIGEDVSFALTDDFFFQEGLFDVASGAAAVFPEAYLEFGTLSGAGAVVVGDLGWESTEMTGTGSTKVTEFGAITYEGEGAFPVLDQRRLITQGIFSFEEGAILMANGARLQNEAEFDVSSEDASVAAQIGIAESSTTNPRIVNKHEFNKESGAGTTTVTVPFENKGSIHQFSGNLNIVNRLGVPASEKFGIPCPCVDPVEAATGAFYESQTDFAIGGLGLGLDLTRTYNAYAASDLGPFGYGWASSFGDRLAIEEEGAAITVQRADGSTVPFTADGKGGFDPPAWSQATLTGAPEAGYFYTEDDQIEYRFAPSGALQGIVDRDGNETTLSYTEAGRLKAVEDPVGRQIAFTYSGEGLIETAEDPMGRLVQYGYEGKELTSVTLPGEEGPRWQFEYDPSHLMTKMIDGRGGETVNEYDEAGRVISQTDPAGRATSFEYGGFHTRMTNEATGAVTDFWFDSNNQPTSVTRGFGTEDAITDSFTYDDAGHNLTRTDGKGNTTVYTYNAAGDRASATDPLENKTEWEYNSTHDIVSETTPGGEMTTIVRDANGNPETVSRPAPGEATQTTSFDYNGLGQLEAMTDPLERTWSFDYDADGNLEAETDPEGNARSWVYDENSQVTAIVSPRGNEEGAEPAEFTTAVQRDPLGRPEKVVDPLGGDSEFVYDGNGNLESETNANGHTTEFVYNPADELIETKKPNGAILKTEYDGAGNVISQIDGEENATTYVRNVLGQPIEIIDPLGRKTIQEYDGAGNLETVIDPMKRGTGYEHDDAGRLEEVVYSDEATEDVNFFYDVDGNLTRMVDGTGESTFDYDQLGRLEEATNGHGDTVAFEYDLANQQRKIVYPNGKDVDRVFDEAGRLEAVTDWLGGTTSFEYDADSNLEAIQFPAASGNVDEFSYDRAGRMLSATFEKGEEPLAAIAYERDPLGQVEAMVSEGLPGPEEETYEYDENERLVKAGSESFAYDKADNPIAIPGSTNAFDAASQLETGTGVTYEYNPMGERVKTTPAVGPATNYAYDQAGNLTSVNRAAEGETPAIDTSYTFDGAGLLASRTSGLTTQHMTWDQSASLPLLLSDDVGAYLYGPYGLPILQIDAEEEPTYLHHDQLGSTRLLTEKSGEAAGDLTFSAYGEIAAVGGIRTTPLGYAGQYTDDDTRLQYLRARFYDPLSSQFLSSDPIKEMTKSPYGYVHSNPVNGTDPSGLFGFDDVKDFATSTLDSLNPIKYYEEEIECLEEGCNYWEAVLKGGQGAAVLACDVTGTAAIGRGLLGRSGAGLLGVEAAGEEAAVVFGHGARHLAGTGLGQAQVEAAIAQRVAQVAPESGFFMGRISLGGRVIEYRAFKLSDGSIKVGTYYPK
ncbi:MAG TPA: RHS repeat-associated core domain-containing protein [Solirubrobacterales bacterium]|nr:RHS repeat-associated core domain-containing protein [Solirubrobacterales bacterium]